MLSTTVVHGCPPLWRRAFAEERTRGTRGAEGQVRGLSAHVHPLAQGAALRPEVQRSSGGSLPGPHEHPGHHAHLRGLLPDRDGLGGGKKWRPSRRSRTRSCPARTATCWSWNELWSFVQSKTQECWLWVALCRRTRQIVAYTIGDRSQDGALSLREQVPQDYRRRATRSDFWLAYESAFPPRTHRFCGKAEGETNHAERWFGTLRSRLGRLVRPGLLLLQKRRTPPRSDPSFRHQLQSQNPAAVNGHLITTRLLCRSYCD